jgi:hypothetical protein
MEQVVDIVAPGVFNPVKKLHAIALIFIQTSRDW